MIEIDLNYQPLSVKSWSPCRHNVVAGWKVSLRLCDSLLNVVAFEQYGTPAAGPSK